MSILHDDFLLFSRLSCYDLTLSNTTQAYEYR